MFRPRMSSAARCKPLMSWVSPLVSIQSKLLPSGHPALRRPSSVSCCC
jgi:hypothetical protein